MQSLFIFILLAVTIYLMIKQTKEVKELQERMNRKVKRITVIECRDGSKKERNYKEGDYIGLKVTEECGEAGGFITAIYGVEPQPQGKKGGQAKPTP
jgi:hypothetical protein